MGVKTLLAYMTELYAVIRTMVLVESKNSCIGVVTEFALHCYRFFVFLFEDIAFDDDLATFQFCTICGNTT